MSICESFAFVLVFDSFASLMKFDTSIFGNLIFVFVKFENLFV